MLDETIINKLEKGRASFAYKCALEGRNIIQAFEIDGEWYKDDKYKSYIRKLPAMILSNGLGQVLAFVLSKRQKDKNKKKAGSKENPKNAYDLIYGQLKAYLLSDSAIRISSENKEELKNKDLVEWIISLDSTEYRYITQEILAFLNWLRKFAEGLIEADEGGEG
jgi:CRISPR-associated protein Cmr5